MERNLILAGVGGQGILTVAQAISLAAMRRGWRVKQAEVHGMSQRGGAVYSHLRIADHEVFSDLIPQGECDLILAMEPMEALRYVEYLRPNGCIVSNTTPLVNITNYPGVEGLLDRIASWGDHALVDADRWARAAGSGLAGNSVLLGAASLQLDFQPNELEEALAEHFARKGPRIVEANRRAFRLGRSAAILYQNALRRGAKPGDVRRRMAALTPEQLGGDDPKDAELPLLAPQDDELSDVVAKAITQLLQRIEAAGRQQLQEHEVYLLVEMVAALSPPRHRFVHAGEALTAEVLEAYPGEKVVLKVVSPDVVHKSDAGAVVFVAKDVDLVNREIEQLIKRQSESGAHIAGVLLVEFVERGDSGFGQELFVGIRSSREFGPVIAAGLGGIDTEYLAHKMKPGIAVAKALALDTSAEEFLELFQKTAAYDILAGRARGHRRVVSDAELLRCFRAFIALARHFCVDHGDDGPVLEELEVNPFAFVRQRMVPLDGRGRLGEAASTPVSRPTDKIAAMLEPRSIAVVGVSSQRVNFGRIILRNTIQCGFPIEHLYAVKPDSDAIDGVRCVPDLARLPEPIDLLVLASGAEGIPKLMDEVIESGGIRSVILIPGGMGETELSHDLPARLRKAIGASRARADGGPIVLGGNCLGIRSRPGRYDTFFIPDEKLDPRRNDPVSPTALITQSGAFIITRISNLECVNPALAITIGNQVDLTVSDLLRAVGERNDIEVIGVYMEGFNDLDGLAFVRAVEDVTRAGKIVIFYKAGRTASGRSATAGHTASIAGDYEVCQTAVAAAGAIVVDTFKEFEQLVELATLFRDKRVGGRRIGVISNAGFEAVGMADAIQGARYELEMPPLSDEIAERIRRTLGEFNLAGLVNVRNPLDLNPMANEEVYVACIRAMLDDPCIDAVVASVVPFTPQLSTTPDELRHPDSLLDRLPGILNESQKPLAIVIDAGRPYDVLAHALRRAGVPVLPACDQAIRSLGRYLCHRSERITNDELQVTKPGLAAVPS